MVGDTQRHAAGRSPACTVVDVGPQPVDRGRWHAVRRYGDHRCCRNRRWHRHAVQQQSGSCQRARQRDDRAKWIHRNVRGLDSRGRDDHIGDDHGQLQRSHAIRSTDGDGRQRAGRTDVAKRDDQPVERDGRQPDVRLRVALRWRTRRRRDSSPCRAATRHSPVSLPASRSARGASAWGFSVATTSVSTTTSVTITATYEGIIAHLDADVDRGRAPATTAVRT